MPSGKNKKLKDVPIEILIPTWTEGNPSESKEVERVKKKKRKPKRNLKPVNWLLVKT